MSNEKVLCDRCDHKPVCSLRAEYMAAQKAVNNVIVSFGDSDGNSIAGKRLNNFTWIKIPELKCVHFSGIKSGVRTSGVLLSD